MIFEEKRAVALELVKRVHAGQALCNGAMPVWHHLDRVSRLLEEVLRDAAEGSAEERETIALAGLGHDAIEDTKVTEEELLAAFGARGRVLIEGMTNRFGDDHPAPYVAQVAAAEEAVRLIKLSDLYDNCRSVTYNLHLLGTAWAESYFLPIVSPMIAALAPARFETYAAAGGRLQGMVRTAYAALLAEVARYKETGR